MTGQIWHSYDFATHVFFASHYQASWWSLWEPRWFDGFDVSSYPPLPHQLAALLGWGIGNGNAVNVLTAIAVVVFPIAIYRLTNRYLGIRAASRAAAFAVVTPSILLAAYAFGQLPTIFALDVGLFTADALGAFLVKGSIRRFVLLLALGGTTVAAHHATFIFFLPPMLGTVLLAEILAPKRAPGIVRRGTVAAVGLGLTAVIVILPFWVWHATEYVNQIPIDHQSRHNLLQDLIAQDLFFWAEHGVLVATLVLALPLLLTEFRRIFPWYAMGAFLFVVGLGGTTPVPRAIFGSQWAWLTYDRFSMWADVPFVILLGAVASRLLDSRRRNVSIGRAAFVVTLSLLGVYALFGAATPALVQTEPAPVDPRPIVAFLQQDGNDRWRYLTLGVGDQEGLLNSLTTAGTVDGYYYTARRLPLLTESGIAQLDYSLLWDPTAQTLRQLLVLPRPYSLRWAFTSDPAYEQILAAVGWQRRTILSNGMHVWEAGVSVPRVGPPPPTSGALGIWWGSVPLAVFASVLPAAWWMRRARDREIA